MKKTIAISLCTFILGISGGLYAAGDKHPNLTTAHNDLQNAKTHITAAQVANEYDMKGHAANAKGLIDQAIEEVRKAREAIDHPTP